MELPIIRIRNSKGIILPKAILDEYNLKDKIELILEKDRIILKPVRAPRQGWEEAFRDMHDKGEEKLFIPDVFEEDII